MAALSLDRTRVSKEVLRFFDIGANLLDDMYKGEYNGKKKHEPDLERVLKRAASFRIDSDTEMMGTVDNVVITAGRIQETVASLAFIESYYSGLGEKGMKLWTTCGVHPTRCNLIAEDKVKYLQSLKRTALSGLKSGRIACFGEFGLDYERLHFCDKRTQIECFEAQLIAFGQTLVEAAIGHLPLFLHLRGDGACADLLPILERHSANWRRAVFHSFDGSAEDLQAIFALESKLNAKIKASAKRYSADAALDGEQSADVGSADNGAVKRTADGCLAADSYCFMIGLNGCSLRAEENCKVIADSSVLPLRKLLLETDSPWCKIKRTHCSAKHVSTRFAEVKKATKWKADKCVKGRCEPCHIIEVAEAIAGIRNIPLRDFCQTVYRQTVDFFTVKHSLTATSTLSSAELAPSGWHPLVSF